MEAEVDAGAVAFEARYEIGPSDTGLSVSATATRLGVPLVGELLEAAAAGDVPAREQDRARRRWYPRAGPHGGRVPWALPARRIVDFVRASDYTPLPSPWGAPLASGAAGDVELVQAALTGEPASTPPGTVERADGAAVVVAAADELVLVQRVRAGGARVAPATALVPGQRLEPGPDPEPAQPG
jgi:methionyl-tRNA formyltransferase